MTIELLRLGDETFRDRRFAEATEIYKRAAEAAQVMGQSAAHVEALVQVAHAHLALGELDLGRPWLQRAAGLAQPSAPAAWSRLLLVRGRYEWREGRRDDALATFTSLHAYCMRHERYERAVESAQMAGVVAPIDRLSHWARQAIAAAEAGRLEHWYGPLWHDLGWILDSLGEAGAALEALCTARDHVYAQGDDRARLIADWSVGHAYRGLGDLASARAWLRETLLWAERRHEAAPSPHSAEWLGRSHWELAELDLAEGAVDACLAHLDAARPLLRQAGLPRRWPEGMQRFEAGRQALLRSRAASPAALSEG